jgi:antitoxin (DNA-binding transcriptional repressor) of toxin-antitoxin stability system
LIAQVSVAEAKDRFAALVARAVAGEEIVVTCDVFADFEPAV